MTFNVGDKVRQIGGLGDPYDSPIGLVGEVTEVPSEEGSKLYEVKFEELPDEEGWLYFEEELQIVAEEPTA